MSRFYNEEEKNIVRASSLDPTAKFGLLLTICDVAPQDYPELKRVIDELARINPIPDPQCNE